MNSVENKYNLKVASKSELGWSITLPTDWEPLESSVADPVVPTPPVVFAKTSDPTLTLTWMALPIPVEPELLSKFSTVTMLEGTASIEEALQVVQHLWPAIGDITEAHVVQLPDSTMALEVVESFYQPDTREIKKGYQLIFCDRMEPDEPPVMQRLCFYAPVNKFISALNDVRAASRSFQYE